MPCESRIYLLSLFKLNYWCSALTCWRMAPDAVLAFMLKYTGGAASAS